jgi:hypothetical protein
MMEKYGVKINPKHKDPDKEKKSEAGEDSEYPYDPNVNVPKDPDKGTEPYEDRNE